MTQTVQSSWTASLKRRVERDRRLKPGTVLVREYQGERHTVTVVPDGFLWRDSTYKSLTTIARAITGTAWSGPRSINRAFRHAARHEKGIQDPAQTLQLMSGSCRDFAMLMIAALRSLGIAARFVSGYLDLADESHGTSTTTSYYASVRLWR